MPVPSFLSSERQKKEVLPYAPICTWKSKNNKSSLKTNCITSKNVNAFALICYYFPWEDYCKVSVKIP